MKTEDITSMNINGIDLKKLDKHPNILLAASYWEKDRYEAAKVCYRFMRRIDDLIDDYKAKNKTINDCEKEAFTEKIEYWTNCLHGKAVNDPFMEEVVYTIRQYQIPVQLFHTFSRSMIYDINNDGFPDFQKFIAYAEGASVSPAAIFVHLCCLNEKKNGYVVPGMDLLEVSRPCAIFSYLVHIIRDFAKDFEDNLNYFAKDLMSKYKVSQKDLFNAANETNISNGFKDLISYYHSQAKFYRDQTKLTLEKLLPFLDSRKYLSMRIIFELYLLVYKRIDVESHNFTTKGLNPSNQEIFDKISDITKKEFRV